jgi:hypothetical protein
MALLSIASVVSIASIHEELHGCSLKTSLKDAAKHEAGHALVLWLLDRYLGGVCLLDHGGVTVSVNAGKPPQVPSFHLLHALAGMEMANDVDVIEDLRDHVATPDYFYKGTDSWLAATLVKAFRGTPLSVFLTHQVALTRFRERFRHPYKEMVNLLLEEPHAISVGQAYEFFGRWDAEFGFDKRPKSDFVMRTLMRECRWKPPKCKWLGWDMKPLEGWTYSRLPLERIMELARAELTKDERLRE